jgi:hypothetical protein
VLKGLSEIQSKINSKIADINLENCLTDEKTKAILKDANKELMFTIEGRQKANKEIEAITGNCEYGFEPYYTTESIINQLQKTFALLSSKDAIAEKDIRILSYLDNGTFKMELHNASKFMRPISISKDVFGFKSEMLDILNKSAVVQFYLSNAIVKHAQRLNYDLDESFLTIFRDVVNNQFRAKLATKTGKITELTLKEIFDQESII